MSLRWLFILFLSISGPAGSQLLSTDTDQYTRFGHLTVSDGLPGNHITVIRQDTTGFLWIGTREGMARFDGTRFRSFLHNPQDSSSLPSDYINDILITSNQQVFVATRKGLVLFHPETSGFQKVPTVYEDGFGLQDKHIRALANADKGHIWVETFNGTLHLLNTQTFEARSWSHQAPTQPYYDYHALLQDSNGTLWIGGRNMGPLKWEKGKITSIKTDPNNPLKKRDRDVAFFFEDSEGDFWMGGLDGLYQYHRDNDIFHKRLSTSSYEMAESTSGNLWVATGKGLARVDKTNQKITFFLPSEDDPSSIIHDHLNCVTTDQDGNIWVGTNRGISILSHTQNLIRHYRHLPESTNSLSNNHVVDLLEDKTGNIWIATRGGGLNQFDPKTSNFRVFNTSAPGQSTISSNHVSALHLDDNKTIWTGLWRGIGFNSFDQQSEYFNHYSLDSTSLKKDWYAGFQSWGTDTLVVGFWGANGIRLFHKKERRWLPHNFRPAYHPGDASQWKILATDTIIWLYEKGGVLRTFHPRTNKYQAFRSNKHRPINQFHKIQSVNIPDFSTLHQMVFHHNLTLFLTNNGLACYNHQTGNFSTPDTRIFLKTAQNQERLLLLSHDGLYDFDFQNQKLNKIISQENLPKPSSQITDLLLLEDQNLALTSASGIQFMNLKTGNSIQPSASFNIINQSDQPIQQIKHGPNNSFLLALDRGLAYISPSGKVMFYNTSNAYKAGLKNDAIRDICLCEQTQGFWISTDRGLFFFDPKTRKFTTRQKLSGSKINQSATKNDWLFLATDQGLATINSHNQEVTFYNQPPSDILSSHLTTFVQKDLNGDIWAGTTNKGLNRINRKTLQVSHFYNGHGFHGSETLAFLETMDGTIYSGGDSLNIFDPITDSFELSTIANKLPHGKIQSLVEDHLGRILIVTSHHINIYNPSSNQIFDLTPYLGSENLTFTPAALKSSMHEIFIGTVNGFFRFKPELLVPEEKTQKTRIVGLMIEGEPLQLPTTPQGPLELEYNENFLKFFFSDMQYPSIHDQYRYKLTGIDKSWNRTNEASVNYKMLPPGSYTFNVEKINPFGGSTQASFPLIIQPPFWLSGWFIVFGILILATVAVIWWTHRIRHLRLLESNLVLKHRLLLSQMNPHFLFNALSAIQSFIFQNQPHAAGSYLAKFAKLMRLYLNNMALPVISIKDEEETLKHYLELQKLRFNDSFDYSLQVIFNANHLSPGLPTMMVQPFVENAVQHGIPDVTWGGQIDIIFSLNEQTWEIIIRDNGIGLEESKTRKQGNPLHRKSMSTNITEKRISQLKKQYKCHCSINITDLTKLPGTQTGTEVKLVIPAINMEKASTEATLL